MELLYRRYYRSALLYCTSLCGNPHLAEDIAADAFVKAYLSLPNNVPSFQYWLLRVCKNLWIDHLRREKRNIQSEPAPADLQTPEDAYLKKEANSALWQAIKQLPSEDREVLILHYFSGLPLKEIALLTGKSYDSTRQRLTRLRRSIKQRLEEQGYGKS